MSRVNAVLLGVIAVLAIGAYSETIGDAPDSFFAGEEYVVGGRPANRAEFPWHATLLVRQENNKLEHTCSGAIITDRFVVSIAHCFPPRLLTNVGNNFRLVLGALAPTGTGGPVYTVRKVIIPNGFDRLSRRHDIALVQTTVQIRFSTYIRAIPIARQFIQPNLRPVLSGWGHNKDNTTSLHYVVLNTLTNIDCRRRCFPFVPPVYDGSLCAYSRQAGVGFSTAGEPLVLHGRLIGLASWRFLRHHRFPEGFIRISEYAPWILHHASQ